MFELPDSPPTLRERLAIQEACRRPNSAALRARVRKKCAADSAWFLSAFAYTYDPRPDASDHDMPFVLYDFQVDTLRWFDARVAAREDGLIDKSRDMGVTWITLGWMLHGWLFGDGFNALIGSRKEDLVDDGTKDSHFGRLEYMVQNLPGWLLPADYNGKKHRQRLKLSNPANGNTITGESSNSNFGRQGRYTAIFFDEGAFWNEFDESWKSASESTRTRIGVSTPNGMNAWGVKIRDGLYKHLRLHWRLHPHKDDAWYAYQKARMTPQELAQEIDISYDFSVAGVVYDEWGGLPRGLYPYVEGWGLYVTWDFGIADDTALTWWAVNPRDGAIRPFDCYANNNKAIDFYVPLVTGIIPGDSRHTYSPEERRQIGEHASLPAAQHFGDPAGSQRSQVTGTSVIEELARHGVHIITNKRKNEFRDRMTETKLGIPRIEGINLPECEQLDQALLNARFPERSPYSKSMNAVAKPYHDWTSHFRSTVEYLFVNLPPIRRRSRPTVERRKMAYDYLA